MPYDGVIGRISSLGARRARRLDLPVVNVWYASSSKGLPSVFPDFSASGQLVAEHLLDRGFRNIGALVNDFATASLVQADAIEQAATEAGFGHRFSKVILGTEATHRDWRRSVEAIEQ